MSGPRSPQCPQLVKYVLNTSKRIVIDNMGDVSESDLATPWLQYRNTKRIRFPAKELVRCMCTHACKYT